MSGRHGSKLSPALGFAVLLPMLVASTHAEDAIASFCESRGGTISTEAAANGNPERFCTLKSGTRINAVAFFRNEHRTHH